MTMASTTSAVPDAVQATRAAVGVSLDHLRRWTMLDTAVRKPALLHALDELLDPLVDRTERVLAQHGPLSLVVQLEMDPVDGEVPPLLQGLADEVTAQLRPRR